MLLAWGPQGWGDELARGAGITLLLAVATLPFGVVLGLLVALARNAREPSLRAAGEIYGTIFRGLPELLTLFIVYYGGQILVQRLVAPFGGGHVELNSFLAGMIALALVFSAFASDVFLGCLRSLSGGQGEAAAALGLTVCQRLRLVILPQLVRLALPGLSNLWLVLLKDTSLVSLIALDDLLRQTGIAVGATAEPFAFYAVACLIYLALATLSSLGLGHLERRLERGRRRLGAHA